MRTRVGLLGGQRVIAIDGKTVRGAKAAAKVAPHLVAALDHTLGVVLGQVQVAVKSNEIPATSVLDRGHGRRVRRTIKVAAAPALLDFSGAVQVAQIRRTRTLAGKKSVEVVYVITSMTSTQASPEQIAAWVQGHWAIENRLHWVRDVVFDEDRSSVRTGHAPRVMAIL